MRTRTVINESDGFSFVEGETIVSVAPIRVTPRAGQPGVYDGGEDTPRARTKLRPRGSTSVNLPPGTRCYVVAGGTNDGYVTPLRDNDELFFDPVSSQEIKYVRVNKNKFDQSSRDEYQQGKGKKLPSVISAAVAQQQARKPEPEPADEEAESDDPILELRAATVQLKRCADQYRAAKARYESAKALFDEWQSMNLGIDDEV